MDSRTPGTSSRPGEGSFDSGTTARTATIPTSATGTPMRKTAPHQKCARTRPPASGPPATAMPAVPAHTPMARPRSSAGKTFVMTASVVGCTAAPPMPMTARQAMSSPGLLLDEASTEPSTKIDSPITSTRRAADAVADDAPGEQQPGEHEDVGVHRPLQLGLRGAEVALQRRQRDVEDRVAHDHHEQADRHGGEHPPAAGVAGRSLLGRVRSVVTPRRGCRRRAGGSGRRPGGGWDQRRRRRPPGCAATPRA